MEGKFPLQFIRIDGKNVFVEAVDSFAIRKVKINFVEYDPSLNNKQTKSIPFYLDLDKSLLLSNDILSGKLKYLADIEMKNKKGSYASPIYTQLGGIGKEKLKEKKELPFEVPDGLCISRMFAITPGEKYPWILSGQIGLGKEQDNGLITPQGKPVQIVRVPMSDDDFKSFAIMIKTYVEGFIYSLVANK